MSRRNRHLDWASRLALDLPIIQAPMAGVQDHVLAAAVSRAGALGSLPCAMLSPAALAAELKALTAATPHAFNVNFFCHVQPAPDPARESAWRARLAPYYAEFDLDPATVPSGPGRLPFSHEAADALEAIRPPVVSFHFGLPPDDLLARVRNWGSMILSSATTLAEARWLQDRGVDAVIAQGLEAGGHRGHFLIHDLSLQTDTASLVAACVEALDVPVVAAGGIATAAEVRRMIGLGAAAAQIGTAYLLSHEATTSAVHRAALTSPVAADAALTNLFTGRPARGIVNRIMRELGPIHPEVPEFPLATASIAPLRARAEALGSGDFSPLWAGAGVGACRTGSAADITLELAREL